MDTQNQSKQDDKYYSINIDKLPSKIQVKIKHIHHKTNLDADNVHKSVREKGNGILAIIKNYKLDTL